MDSLFVTKLAVSFFIGGFWVVLATVLADKLGSKVGGFISGLPSTVMFGLFFLGWTQNTGVAVQATTIIPIVGGINCLFLTLYSYFVKENVWKAIGISMIFWALLSFFLVRIHFNNYLLSLVGYIALLGISFYLMEKVFKVASARGKKVTYTSTVIASRALLGGLVVALAVYLGKIGGPILGGMFSMFPAMFISTMLVTYFSQGALFSAGTMKSAMVSGISIVIYSISARYFYVPLGLVGGTLVSIFISFLSGFLVYRFVVSRLN